MKIYDVNTRIGEDQNPELLEGDLAVKNMLMNLFSTPLGTERFAPDYGTTFDNYLQEPVSRDISDKMLLELLGVVASEIPQVKVVIGRTYIVPNYSLPGYDVGFAYESNLSNTTGIIQFSIAQEI
jgi:hypothetical protein